MPATLPSFLHSSATAPTPGNRLSTEKPARDNREAGGRGTLKHKLGIIIGLLAATGLTVGAFYSRRGNIPPEVTTVAVSRGTITSEIAATGTLEAVTTVEVGTQVSGTIQALYADFNSIVKKGQV